MTITVDGNGNPIMVVTADGARKSLPMRRGETDDAALARADTAGDQLRADRNAAASVRLQGGATETRIAPRPGTGGGQQVEAADAQAKANAGRTPGERMQGSGSGDANYPPYPSEIKTYNMHPPKSPITVTGGTNDFTMELDRGNDVFNYFQPINYYWEVIQVTGTTPEQRASALEQTLPGQGQRAGSGDWADIRREARAIREDVENEDWVTLAAQWQLVALSAGVRMIGSVISAFFASLTRPAERAGDQLRPRGRLRPALRRDTAGRPGVAGGPRHPARPADDPWLVDRGAPGPRPEHQHPRPRDECPRDRRDPAQGSRARGRDRARRNLRRRSSCSAGSWPRCGAAARSEPGTG